MSTPDNTARETLIERIRKLTKMTTQNGCSESEAATAAEMVAKLIAEHNVGIDELKLKADAQGCIKDEFIDLQGLGRSWVQVLAPITDLFHLKGWTSVRHEDVLGIGVETEVLYVKLFGYPADVAAGLALTAICYTAMMQELNTWSSQKGNKGQHKAKSFLLGMAERLSNRIREQIPPKPICNTGTALIVLKDQLVTDEFAKYCRENDLKLYNRRGYTADPRAYGAGQSAAARVDLGHGPRATARTPNPQLGRG